MPPVWAREHWLLSVISGAPLVPRPAGPKGGEANGRRLAAARAVYEIAPAVPSMSVVRDPERNLYGRKHASGALAGFWAALALTECCVATYRDGEARIAAAENEEIVVPLPPGARVRSVTAVLHAGEERPHRFSPAGDGILVTVPDAAGPVKYVKVVF
jgi:hypothetical protein